MVQEKSLTGKGRPIKVRIPVTFKCFGHTVQVLKVPHSELIRMSLEEGGPDDENIDGMYDHENKVIYLREDLPYDRLEPTYLHEKSHCILEHMGELELSADEKFVELMAQVMYQIEKTSRGTLQTLSYRKGIRTPEGKSEFRQRRRQKNAQ